jgi:hypothetical protein
VLRVHDPDEGDVVDLVGDVVQRRAADRRLELARQVRERRVADEAPRDLLDGRRAVEDLVSGHAGHGGAQHHPRRVTAGLLRAEADALEPLPDRRDVLDADPVQLDVLPIGHVGRVAPVRGGHVRDRPQLGDRELPAVDAHAQHEVLVVELVGLQTPVLPPSMPGRRWVYRPHQRSRPRRSAGSMESNPRWE